MLGGNGQDVLVGSEGDDDLRGGAGFDIAQYKDLGEAITLGGSGLIDKYGLGTDTILDIEQITADASQTNTIDGELNADGNAAFNINLEDESLEVEIVNPDSVIFGTTFSFVVKNFDDVVGTVNSDSITGDSQDNVFVGSGGSDLLDGNAGFDTADYEDIGTSITLNATGILEKEGIGTDTLRGIEEIIGDSSFINTIDASFGNNSEISVNLDEETLEVVVFSAAVGPLNFTVENFDNVVGSSNNDFIVGSSSDNTFFGSGGNDIIDGFSTVTWSPLGNTVNYSDLDTSIVLGGSGEIVKEGLGTDTIDNINTIIGSATQTNTIDGQLNAEGNAAFNIDLSANELEVEIVDPTSVIFGETFEFRVENFNNVVGTVNSDDITGDIDNNVIFGSSGNDVIDGGDGFDTLNYSDLGAGVTVAATGFVLKGGLLGGLGEDNFSNIEAIIGDSQFVNTVDGQTPFTATASLDVDLESGTIIVDLPAPLPALDPISIENFDNVIGSDIEDTIAGNSNSNSLSGRGGDDVITGAGGSDFITGDIGDDELFGNNGDDELIGGNGNDFIDGGKNRDRLIGVGEELGANDVDQLTGGTQRDTFVLGNSAAVFYEGIGFAQILDFETGIDTIELNGTADDYTFGTFNRSISLNGDLIATTNLAFNINTDLNFV